MRREDLSLFKGRAKRSWIVWFECVAGRCLVSSICTLLVHGLIISHLRRKYHVFRKISEDCRDLRKVREGRTKNWQFHNKTPSTSDGEPLSGRSMRPSSRKFLQFLPSSSMLLLLDVYAAGKMGGTGREDGYNRLRQPR